MSKFLRGLRRLGLVETDETDADNSTGSAHADAVPPEPVASEPLPPLPPVASEIAENRPFEDIYREHAIPDSPYPAEKLLKVLDGLRALEPSVRKSAVLAIDQADETWTIDDAVLDAERKIKALDASRAGLKQVVQASEERARGEIEACERQLQETVTRIRQQIMDLEALQAREVEQATQAKAAIEAAVRATREACVRETNRLSAGMATLGEVPIAFAAGPAPTLSSR